MLTIKSCINIILPSSVASLSFSIHAAKANPAFIKNKIRKKNNFFFKLIDLIYDYDDYMTVTRPTAVLNLVNLL